MQQDLAFAFRRRFRARERLVGTFLKTPAPHLVEVIASAGFDFVVIDEEHAPFGREITDQMLFAAAAAGLPALVRTPDCSPSHILGALDDGAAGVVGPHIDTAIAAASLVSACRYSGARGFSASTRAGGYGAQSMWQHVDTSDAATTVIAMIEDPAGAAAIDEILAVEGLDGIFVGRADMAVALDDREPGSPRSQALAAKVIKAAQVAKVPSCLFVSNAAEAEPFADDVSAFVVSSDQGILRDAAMRYRADITALQTR